MEEYAFPGFEGEEVVRPGLAEINRFFLGAWREADTPSVTALITVDRDGVRWKKSRSVIGGEGVDL